MVEPNKEQEKPERKFHLGDEFMIDLFKQNSGEYDEVSFKYLHEQVHPL